MTDIEIRMDDLEKRVLALEDRTRRFVWSREEERTRREKELVDRYGEHVDKSTAAKILGVTRATVYTMLADGRIDGAFGGKRVDVRSIARYMYSPRGMKKHRGMKNGREADAACSNANRASE